MCDCLTSSRLDAEGVSRSSRHVRRGAMDVLAAPDERCRCGRRSRVVLTPRRWCQVRRTICARWEQESPVPRESAKESVKTVAQGRPGIPAEPVVPSPCFFHCTGAMGISRYPAFPAPSHVRESETDARLGRSAPRERESLSARRRRMTDSNGFPCLPIQCGAILHCD